MDARFCSAALALLAILSCGAGRPQHSVRSQFFIVSAPTPQLAEEICQAAEAFRRDLAIEWLGRELPPWREPCPIVARVSPQLGAGGVTSFMFDRGTPFGWTMEVQGTRERVLDSVLPHEITHTIFATHFGRPLPRWADEGACTTVESEGEKKKQEKFLIQFLQTERGIPFNQMFAMREYPADILPLYSQGYSLARYLIQQGGKPKFVEFVGEGMQTNNWTGATRKFYGFSSLSELQVTWVAWVEQGSPDLNQVEGLVENQVAANNSMAATQPPGPGSQGFVTAASPAPATTQLDSLARPQQIRPNAAPQQGWQEISSQNGRQLARDQQFSPPHQPSTFGAQQYALGQQPGHSSVARPVSEGWYAKRRDQAQAVMHSNPDSPVTAPVDNLQASPQRLAPATGGIIPAPPTRSGAPQPATAPQGDRRVLLEWSRARPPVAQATGELPDLAMGENKPIRR